MKGQHENEEVLTGGNVSNVSRLGETVRREVKPESVKIHKLLEHILQVYPDFLCHLLM